MRSFKRPWWWWLYSVITALSWIPPRLPRTIWRAVEIGGDVDFVTSLVLKGASIWEWYLSWGWGVVLGFGILFVIVLEVRGRKKVHEFEDAVIRCTRLLRQISRAMGQEIWEKEEQAVFGQQSYHSDVTDYGEADKQQAYSFAHKIIRTMSSGFVLHSDIDREQLRDACLAIRRDTGFLDPVTQSVLDNASIVLMGSEQVHAEQLKNDGLRPDSKSLWESVEWIRTRTIWGAGEPYKPGILAELREAAREGVPVRAMRRPKGVYETVPRELFTTHWFELGDQGLGRICFPGDSFGNDHEVWFDPNFSHADVEAAFVERHHRDIERSFNWSLQDVLRFLKLETMFGQGSSLSGIEWLLSRKAQRGEIHVMASTGGNRLAEWSDHDDIPREVFRELGFRFISKSDDWLHGEGDAVIIEKDAEYKGDSPFAYSINRDGPKERPTIWFDPLFQEMAVRQQRWPSKPLDHPPFAERY